MEGKLIGDYLISKAGGKGTMGKVYSAVHMPTKKIVAIKTVPKTNENISREISLMKVIDHPFIVTLFDVIETPTNYCLVMEFVEGITLLDYIKTKGKTIEPWFIRHVFCQILSCLIYLHNKMKIVHRDLKLENIIVDHNMNIRILDFGLSNISKQTDNSLFKTHCGSVCYAAPEMIDNKDYSFSVDIWSLGIILYCLQYRRFPFCDENMSGIYQKIHNEEPFFQCQYNDINAVIRQCLKKNPDERPSSMDLLNLKWIQGYQNPKLLSADFGIDEQWVFSTKILTIDDKIMRRYQIVQEMASLLKQSGHVRSFLAKTLSGRTIICNRTSHLIPMHGHRRQSDAHPIIKRYHTADNLNLSNQN